MAARLSDCDFTDLDEAFLTGHFTLTAHCLPSGLYLVQLLYLSTRIAGEGAHLLSALLSAENQYACARHRHPASSLFDYHVNCGLEQSVADGFVLHGRALTENIERPVITLSLSCVHPRHLGFSVSDSTFAETYDLLDNLVLNAPFIFTPSF